MAEMQRKVLEVSVDPPTPYEQFDETRRLYQRPDLTLS
jgi:hypothetical protein